MIKIDFKKYVRDRCWFGLSYEPNVVIAVTGRKVGMNWFYSDWWTLRLWPVRLNGQTVPEWYMAIFNYFGYAKDYEAGIE